MATELSPPSSTIRILHRKPARLHTLKLHTHTTQKAFMRWLLVNIALITNLISFLFITMLSFAVATQTFKYRLDPDNFVIPLVTSIADFGATLALITALRILNV